MVRVLTVILVLVLASLACSLSGSDEPTVVPSPRPLSSNLTPTSPFVVITNTPTATSVAPTSTPFTNGSSGNGNVTTCTKRTDWYVYTVKSGDTLSAIARSVQSDTGTLQNANCLTNPNSLSVGQVLYVPRQPIPPTITPVPTTPVPTDPGVVYLGRVTFSEGTYLDNDNLQLTAGHTVTLAYPEVDSSASHVQFLLATADGKVAGVIGTDSNLGDGATTTWTVPTGLNANLVFANMFVDSIKVTQTSLRTKVHTNSVATEGSIPVSHFVLDNGEGVLTLQPGATITVTYIGARTDLGRADFALYNYETDGWTGIGVDNNLADGASIEWTVPYGLGDQKLFASTYDANGTQFQMQMTNYSVYSIDAPTTEGKIRFFPMLGSGDPNNVYLASGSDITLIWYEVPLEATKIDFYFQQDYGDGEVIDPVLLGSDTDWLDGATLEFNVPAGISGSMYAIAHLPDDELVGESEWVHVTSD